MSDAAVPDLPLRVRNPQVFSLSVAAFMGTVGAALQAFSAVPSTTLTAWEIGALLAALVLWSMPSLEASTLAYARRNRDWISFAALAFGYGYFWAVCMILMQWGSTTLVQLWMMFGVAGALFGMLLARAQSDKNALQLEPLFTHDHALGRSTLIASLYLAWPIIVVVFFTRLFTDNASAFTSIEHVPAMMLMALVLWPMSYDVTDRYRRVYLTNVVLGTVLVVTVSVI